MAGIIGCLLLFGPFIILFIISQNSERKKKEKYDNGLLDPIEAEKYKNKLLLESEKNEKIRKHKTILKTMIVASDSNRHQKMGSSIIRGTIGGALLGPVGMISGAMSGKHKNDNTTTFLVLYEDGHKETIITETNSSEFKKLCQYLEI